jgi:hypothetical protein
LRQNNPDGPELPDKVPGLESVETKGRPVGEHSGYYVADEESWGESSGVVGRDVVG